MNETRQDPGGHPRGTFALLALFGALFAIGWLLVYFLLYAPRGALTP